MDVGCTPVLGYIIDLDCVLLHLHRALSLGYLSFLLFYRVSFGLVVTDRFLIRLSRCDIFCRKSVVYCCLLYFLLFVCNILCCHFY